MSILFYTPTFTNMTGFTSAPSSPGSGVPATEGWYEDVGSGLVRFCAIFRQVGVSLLAASSSFQSALPWAPDGTQPVYEISAKLTGNVATVAVSGSVSPTTTISSPILATFPLLQGLTGLTSAVITISGSYKAFS